MSQSRDSPNAHAPAMFEAAFAMAAPDLAAEAGRWLAHLAGERRVSPTRSKPMPAICASFSAISPCGSDPTSRLSPASSRPTSAPYGSAAGGRDRQPVAVADARGLRSFARHLERAGKGNAAPFPP